MAVFDWLLFRARTAGETPLDLSPLQVILALKDE
jgi:hypothetical protein